MPRLEKNYFDTAGAGLQKIWDIILALVFVVVPVVVGILMAPFWCLEKMYQWIKGE